MDEIGTGHSWTVGCGQRRFEGVQAVIFDKDGTLANSLPYLKQLGRRRVACLEKSYPGVGSKVAAALDLIQGKPHPDGLLAIGTRQSNIAAATAVLTTLGRPVAEAQAEVERCFNQADRANTEKAQQTPPFPGTTAMLARLSRRLCLGLLSSDSPSQVNRFLERYHLSPYFQGWLGTAEGQPPKPDPKLLRQLCRQLGVAPGTVLIIGDSIADQQLAARSGVAGFISVSQSWGRPPLAGADGVITDWDDLVV